MQVKTKKLSTKDFVTIIRKLTKEFQAIQTNYNNKLEKLGNRFIADNCEFKVSDILHISESPDGFTSFTIEMIVPDIHWESNTVRLKAYGTMSGEGVEDAEKMIWLDQLNKVPITEPEQPNL